MRGCFGGCSFCSITEHEGRIIQSRSEGLDPAGDREIRDKVPGFTGVISDLGGPTANMYRMACKAPAEPRPAAAPPASSRTICPNLNTDHDPAISSTARRALKGIKKVLIASGVRYDLAVEEPALHQGAGHPPRRRLPEDRARAHRGGPALQDDEAGHGRLRPLQGAVRQVFGKEAGKKQYLIPYFIAAHPGTTDEDMLNLALWLKRQRLPRRPGADLPALAHGHRDRDVPLGRQPAAREVRRGTVEPGRRRQGRHPAPPAQSLPALPRPGQLAAAARGADLQRMGRGELIGSHFSWW
jgi:hypothetical protein